MTHSNLGLSTMRDSEIMSQVSTVIIITSSDLDSKEPIAALNIWLTQHGVLGQHPLQKISSESSAGNKYPQRTLYWGGFDSLREDAFIEFFKTLKWQLSETVLILGPKDADSGYRIVLSGGDSQVERVKAKEEKDLDSFFKDLEL